MPRKSEFNQAQADEICEHLANGGSLRAWCAREANPTFSTVYKWLEQQASFADEYARARERQAHNDADRLNELVEDLQARQVPADVARVMIDALKWTAARRCARSYGDKVQVGGDQDGAPLIVTWAGGDKL
jgi:transposase